MRRVAGYGAVLVARIRTEHGDMETGRRMVFGLSAVAV